jgi:hypothetical protein
MSIEQTTQLIQLILNSVLMVAVSAAVWLGLMLRWMWLDILLRGEAMGDRRSRWERRSDRRLKRHHQTVTTSLLIAHGSLLLLVASTLLLALRTLMQANWLIQLSMGLFVLGVGGLLLGLGLCLTDWALAGDRKPSRLERRLLPRALPPAAPASLMLKRKLESRLHHKVG